MLKFYKVEHAYDEYGLTPKVYLKGIAGASTEMQFLRERITPNMLWENPEVLKFEFDEGFYEGPPRFLDLQRCFNWTLAPCVIVSLYFKDLLTEFHLPLHRFYPVEVHFEESQKKKFGNVYEQYYLLHLLYPSPEAYFDVIGIKPDKKVELCVSEYVKRACEITGISGLKFTLAAELEEPLAEVKTKLDLLLEKIKATPFLKPVLRDKGVLDHFQAMAAKRNEVLKNLQLVSTYYTQLNDDSSISTIERKVRYHEKHLNVIFPPSYRQLLLLKSRPKAIGEFKEVFKLEELIQVGNDYQNSRPQAVNAIAVMGDGSGDYLGYLLKEDSQYELEDRLYHFKHEIGDIKPTDFQIVARKGLKLF